ncbi:Structural maintenance of chromosomes protein 6 [Savitreella phatthalungensis]
MSRKRKSNELELDLDVDTQAPSSAPRYAEAGVVESVTLVDFMCHDHLHIDLCPNMNFIIGHNGSGKSAILTALTTCLGGKATNSGRGNSVKELVKHGRQQAIVTVRLRNRGEDAYRPEDFGDTIIVERRINADGGGSYLVRGKDRTVHGRKREDLDAITDHFGLAIDNPMNVLTQDVARQFLANATPRVLYDLFMKGVELQQLEADHTLLDEQINTTKAVLEARSKSLGGLVAEEQEASRAFDATERARKAEDELDKLREHMAWAHVAAVEEERDAAKVRLERFDNKLLKIRELKETASARLATINDERNSIVERQRNLEVSEQGPINEKLRSLRDESANVKAEHQQFLAEQRDCHASMKRAQTDTAKLEKDIGLEEKKLEDNVEGRRLAELRRQRGDLEGDLGRMREELEGIEAQLQTVSSDRSRLSDERDTSSATIEILKKDLDREHERLNALRRVAADSTAAYNKNMVRLLREIEREHRWQRKPIGPIGTTMKLLHQEWSDIVETFFGRKLNAFVVTNYNDKRLLLSLMQRLEIDNCPVVQGDERGFDRGIAEPEAQYLTILRAIEWSDELVKRQLIIGHRPENQLLIRDRREADLTMNCDNPPANAACAFALDANNPRLGWRLGGGVRGSSMSIPVQEYRFPKRLTQSGKTEMRDAEEAIQAAQRKLESEKNVRNLQSQRLKELDETYKQLDRRQNDILRDIATLQRKLDAVKADIESGGAVDDSRLRALQDNLAKHRDTQRVLEEQYRGFEEEAARIQARVHAAGAKIVEAEKELGVLRAKANSLGPRVHELVLEEQQLQSDGNHYERQITDYSDRRERQARELDERQALVNSHTDVASQICATRPDVQDTVRVLERKIDDRQRAIEKLQRSLGNTSVDDVTRRLELARDNLKQARADIDELESLAKELSAALEDRVAKRKHFRQLICSRTKDNFERHMYSRNFSGKLSFHHKQRELDMTVVPAGGFKEVKRSKSSTNGAPAVSRDNKGLSGGEKSFTTICLLLSIWEAMGCPIRALDEFDVFMDSVNRGISMSMMIASANAAVERQFILITPQDMGGVKPTATTKILRLEDPVRGVTQAA